jgi:flagellar biosynthesis/type III secretory pathway protein FliH
MPALRLEVFTETTATPSGTVVTDGEALEEQRLAAYEQGYAAGWDDSVAAQDSDQARQKSEASRALQALAFTYEEARAHVLRGLEPLLRAIVQHALPQAARGALAGLVLDAARPVAAELADAPVTVVLHPATRPLVEPHMAEAAPFPYRFEEEPGMAEGQVHLRLGDAETRIDIDETMEAIAAAIDAFFSTLPAAPEKDRRHG